MNQQRIFIDPQRAEKSACKVEDINVALEFFLLGLDKFWLKKLNLAPQKHK